MREHVQRMRRRLLPHAALKATRLKQRRKTSDSSSGQAAWTTALLVALSTAVVTSALNWGLWSINRRAVLSEKLLDHRLIAVSHLAASAMKYRELRRPHIVVATAIVREKQLSPATSLEAKAAIEKRLRRLMPQEFAAADKATDEAYPELRAELLMAQLYFGPKTRRAVHAMDVLVTQPVEDIIADYAANHPDAVREDNSRVTVHFDAYALAKYADAQYISAVEGVLNAMRDEMVGDRTIWQWPL